MAVKLCRGRSGALCIAAQALLLAGLPTTSTFASRAAQSFSACPCALKMPPFSFSSSLRSIPAPRGLEPTSRA